jgi:hypothetical protein
VPIPYARVELAETDYSNIESLEDPCIKHVTAAVLTDGDGRFRFDYVRQTECSDVFEMRGFEPGTHHVGRALGRVRYVGQVVELDIVLLGRGLVRGRVTYDDGTVPAELRVVAASPVFLGRAAPASMPTALRRRRSAGGGRSRSRRKTESAISPWPRSRSRRRRRRRHDL